MLTIGHRLCGTYQVSASRVEHPVDAVLFPSPDDFLTIGKRIDLRRIANVRLECARIIRDTLVCPHDLAISALQRHERIAGCGRWRSVIISCRNVQNVGRRIIGWCTPYPCAGRTVFLLLVRNQVSLPVDPPIMGIETNDSATKCVLSRALVRGNTNYHLTVHQDWRSENDMETEDSKKLIEFAYMWGDLMDLSVFSVLEDNELSEALQNAMK